MGRKESNQTKQIKPINNFCFPLKPEFIAESQLVFEILEHLP